MTLQYFPRVVRVVAHLLLLLSSTFLKIVLFRFLGFKQSLILDVPSLAVFIRQEIEFTHSVGPVTFFIMTSFSIFSNSALSSGNMYIRLI